MESFLFELLEYGVGALIGFALGVVVLALVRASDADNLPTPPAWRTLSGARTRQRFLTGTRTAIRVGGGSIGRVTDHPGVRQNLTSRAIIA
jgi:hypothetical protein